MAKGRMLGLLAVVALVGFANTARADLDALKLYLGDPPALGGFMVNEMKIDFTDQYTGSQLLLNLSAGSVYQNGSVALPYGPPTAAEIGGDALAAYDTFTAQGSLTSSGPSDTPDHVDDPFASNLGSTGPALFDTTGLDIEWFPDGGITVGTASDYLVARVTLSDDATGTWEYLASVNGTLTTVAGSVTGGSMGAILGDTNYNGAVNGIDVDVLAQAFAPGVPNGNSIMGADFNVDGFVDGLDVDILAQNFTGSVAVANPVPEPGTLCLLGFAGILGLVSRRFRK